MEDENPEQPIVGGKEEIRSLIELQHERLHQLQSLSQGLLTANIGVLTIVTTILVATSTQIPSLPNTNQIASAAQSVPLEENSVSVILGFNLLLVIVFAGMSLYAFFRSFYHFFETVVNDGLRPKIQSEDVLLIRDQEQSTDGDLLPERNLSSVFYESIYSNNIIINKLNIDFLNGALRIPFYLLLGFLSAYIYFLTSNTEVISLLMMNLVFLLPSSLVAVIQQKLFFGEKPDPDTIDSSIGEELYYEDEPESRWNNVKLARPEKWLGTLATLLCLFSLLAAIFGIS